MLDFRNLNKIWISEKMKLISNKDIFLLVTYTFTNSFSINKLMKTWKLIHSRGESGRNRELTSKLKPEDLGGAIGIYLIKRKKDIDFEPIVEIDISTPMGSCFNEETGELLVGSSYGIFVIKKGNVTRILEHNLFSQVHGISKTKHGFLAACSNTDSLVEFTFNNKTNKVNELWSWLAIENGYNITPKGLIRKINKNYNYQYKQEVGTIGQSTHINSAIEIDEKNILATLFHQGMLIAINKETKESKIILKNLKNPHHIKKIKKGYYVSDTGNNKLIILNADFSIKKIIKHNFNRVQDSQFINKLIIVADNNNSRFVIFDNKFKYIKKINWCKNERKVGSMSVISAEQIRRIFNKK